MRDGGSWGSASFLRGAGMAALLAWFGAAAAFAADGRPLDGIDPAPPVVGPGADAGWSVSVVPDLPRGAKLGELWTAPGGDFWLWAVLPPAVPGLASDGDGEPGEIERPGGPDLSSVRAQLYRHTAAGWSVAMPARAGTPGALFGTSGSDVWATTSDAAAVVNVWHYDGVHWTADVLPQVVTGRTQVLAGEAGDVWLRVGETILRRDAQGWTVNHELPAGVGGGGLVALGGGRVLAPTSCGHCLFDGVMWHAVPESFTFAGVTDAWGMRAPCGSLCLYAAGCNEADNGIRVWRFTEGSPGSLAGCWGGRDATVFADPPDAGSPGLGRAAHVWGSARNDVYVAGTLAGHGEIARFDGLAWTKHEPVESMAPVTGMSGTGAGGTWFALEDGRVLHYRRPNTAPVVSHALAEPTLLSPADGELYSAAILGVTDLDGDWLKVRVTGITQDEPVIEPQKCLPTCPDGAVGSSVALLRAERTEGGNGRVYEVTFVADDGFDGVSEGRVRVGVPVAAGIPPVDDGQRYVSTGPCEPSDAVAGPTLHATTEGGRGVHVGFRLERTSDVVLEVYDVAGRTVATLARGSLSAGAHERTWAAEGARPGVYFVRLRGAGLASARTVILPR